MITTPTATTAPRELATTATTVSTPALTVTRTRASGKTRTFTFERAILACTRDERATLQGRLFQQQLANGQYRPFITAILGVFGRQAQDAAFSCGIAAKGPIGAETFQEFVRGFNPQTPASGWKGEKALFMSYIRAMRG